MKFRTNWYFEGGKNNKSNDGEVELTSDDIIELAKKLKTKGDVIYTYHPNYMRLGARIAFWGTESDLVAVDVQFSSHACVGEVKIEELPKIFENYADVISNPKNYGLKIEE